MSAFLARLVRPGVCVAVLLFAGSACAQDLFELEVFDFDTTAPGAYEVEVHTNGVSRGGVRTQPGAAAHQPVHMSLEVTRGWTRRLATAVFIQTAPLVPARGTWFAGGHVRAKVRLTENPRLPFRVGVSAEYGFNPPSFDHELQTLEISPILDRREGRLSLILNPGIELVIKGSERGLDPSFDLSASAGWSLSRRVSLSADYISRPGTTRHLDTEDSAHHLIFSVVDVALSDGFQIGVGAGHCVTSNEPWVFRSVLGFRFRS